MVCLAGRDHLADETNTRVLVDYPGAALAHAAILQYRPVNVDILPVFDSEPSITSFEPR
jgi:hypothetical protein